MSLLLRLKQGFGRSRPTPSELENGELLVAVFEENNPSTADIERFKGFCVKHELVYEQEVVRHLIAAADRRFFQLGEVTEIGDYSSLLVQLKHHLDLFDLPVADVREFRSQLLSAFNRYCLVRLRKVSRDNLLGLECVGLSLLVDVFAFDRLDRESGDVNGKLTTMAEASVRGCIKYIRTTLRGDNPRFDNIFRQQRTLISLAGSYHFADRSRLTALIFKLTEEIYEKCHDQILLGQNMDLIYQTPEKVIELAQENMERIGYRGPWRERLLTIDVEESSQVLASSCG